MNIPGEEKDRFYDSLDVPVDEVIERHIKLAHRTELILMLLKTANIPFSRFTREALDQASARLEEVCGDYDMGYDD